MFLTQGDVVRALKRYRDSYDPKTASIMLVGAGTNDPHGEPFRKGFISFFEERAELARRIARLDERSRRLLALWHVEGRPVTEIARMIGVSRVHCYRLNRVALDSLVDDAGRDEQPAAATA